ncbi:MAG: hypothetical protein JSU96_09425 [Acidobacteriota bacterium]|nr:MAG: hypothetical protein JSU96_09425 [Acidobacteriota bacterium]
MGIAGAIRQIDPVQRLESELSVEEIRSRYDLEQLRCEWDSLQDQIRLPSLFLNIDWILNWWKHFGGNRQMLVVALRPGYES